MCGIAGVVGTGAGFSRPGAVERMVGVMRRRGPDGSGIEQWADAVLGHRRLAILDLSGRAGQPMLLPDRSVGVVFNGAIYNFVELREELRAGGHRFGNDSDTEVLLHGYVAWGVEALVRRLSGMFAFGLWDDRTRELFLVRDRLGVKPLLYCESAGELAFASTAGALRSAGHGSGLDAQMVADYLEWGVVPEQRSIWQGIAKLPPATVLRWHAGRSTQTRYWAPPLARPAGSISFADAVDETERLLLSAVRRRTRADVPIGALLSGGVDSALVCWALKEVGSEVTAFTFSTPGQPEDESAAARATAQELDISLETLVASASSDDWSDLLEAYSEPFACASALGMLRLAKSARNSVTVLLTGDGGDDVFLGYPHHRFLYLAGRLAGYLPGPAARALHAAGISPAEGWAKGARNFGGYLAGGLPAFLRVRGSYRMLRSHGVLGTRLAGIVPATQQLPPRPGSGRTLLPDYLEFAREHQFVAEYLAKVDGATMYHSLEARSPFLDHELWEFAASLPFEVRLRNGELKAVLREIARRRIGPRVATGAKRGFEVPVGARLAGEWRDRTRALFAMPLLREQGWLDSRPLLSMLDGRGRPPVEVWYVAVLESWLRQQD
jgi:asparagine synthase (glutamine-hydrolysing)